MASHDHETEYHRGEMEISEQVSTFHFVMAMTKWGSLFIAAAVLFFVMWLYPRGDFMLAAVSTVALLVVGVVALREKKGGGH